MTPCPHPCVAAALIAARRSGQPAPASDLAHVLRSDDQAYAIQDAVAQALGWFDGGPPRHWKSGGAARTAALTHAALPAAGVRTAGQSLADLRWHQPAVEAEIALRLARDVTPAQAQQLTHADAPYLVDAVAVAIEIADSRWQEGLQAPAALRLADQGSHGALLLGGWLPNHRGHDWAGQRCEVRFGAAPGAAPAIENTGAYSLGDPLWLLPIWLRHATRGARTVPAHTVVTTGSWVGALPMPADTDILVRFPGLGEVGLRAGRVHAAPDASTAQAH
ncbi:fumarylacetoacetate hydrolase family protein [Verminephrobacter aporrectodeae]|uniref:2-keto-4-pentenoate hydratase n=1 Tax=Verminephrobacter aporrectodeae subsp. tuberculatae TaxID=1110392 RepID=A0ABT3KRF8_9BURK|nr:fumarylacetoacetate hydrolase family protein [Verminephrobacter aporrectodeae]MCW5220138.1 2-keto-4-pentenoate hydratase [Verminephrobacter aporrectodeae subsp. tuberculatae]MCW5255899.1 2-keto-4-pentenoate hydratase [Verminephrobacter aporrectodeae subsp. tuberculatae]MCW5289426.1 2-keto-4-pentenoate hydratase [Verminephrobacter aporrectodeae subsp. tuberculatae]MCW5320913.1 2-keto-4-pentenoate hydratase [Verminephrobacter aporrectodeae subsp. tuberculatae]MCW8175673.1 2-keto-4-pentenoate 